MHPSDLDLWDYEFTAYLAYESDFSEWAAVELGRWDQWEREEVA